VQDNPDLDTVLQASQWAEDEVLRLHGLPARETASSATP
jgi:hypothetical protein